MPSFYEFFAGGGMARAGLTLPSAKLELQWECAFANDFDRKKATSYKENWGGGEFVLADIRNVDPVDMPGRPDLVWASFPCQDLSLAGAGAGLRGDRSGTFWPFIHQIKNLRDDGRAPKTIVLENVVGTLTSHGGSDFSAICEALARLGYRYGAIVVDAALFVPQSRPRLFVVAVRHDVKIVGATDGPRVPWHTLALRRAYSNLSRKLQAPWIWWELPRPKPRTIRFSDIIEENPNSVRWHTKEETNGIISLMSDVNLAKVRTAQNSSIRMVGGVYRRTRFQQGLKVQRAEVRFDDIAGCLRTPAGGSSRQILLVVEGQRIRSRLISSRETARLMGLPDRYSLPTAYSEAYHLTGDGVVVQVVSHIAKHIIEPIIVSSDQGEINSASDAVRTE